MSIYIASEFWIRCSLCDGEEVINENAPTTGRSPKTKHEAWAAAKVAGWKGSFEKPVCEYCVAAQELEERARKP